MLLKRLKRRGTSAAFGLPKCNSNGYQFRRMQPESLSLDQGQIAVFYQRHRTGLVTLVFTDLVDSTALMRQLGDQAGTTFLQQRRQILRQTLKEFPDGEEIETAGDSPDVTEKTLSINPYASCVQFLGRTTVQPHTHCSVPTRRTNPEFLHFPNKLCRLLLPFCHLLGRFNDDFKGLAIFVIVFPGFKDIACPAIAS